MQVNSIPELSCTVQMASTPSAKRGHGTLFRLLLAVAMVWGSGEPTDLRLIAVKPGLLRRSF
jgi:hypothetical protein